jgi:dephospho-CoA kinase
LVAIHISDKMRYNLLFERGRSDDPKNKNELKLRDKRENKFGIKKVIKKADYTIKNNATINELKLKTRELVQKIIENY